ncbi:hypothetical protein F2Q69_00004681 [Brassica cretica]|uniref:Uncharacterized protein n=1 Tax=Brassica cretica TaxID=69181 RepID=A0A8S9PKC8_BRACR|nr:hypothetical protein F2Q69_00004681 [Brassica cretica]
MPSFDGTSKPPLKWRRVLLKDLKVSGAAQYRSKGIMSIAREVSAVNRLGIKVILRDIFDLTAIGLRLLLEEEISFVDPPGLGPVALIVPLLIVSLSHSDLCNLFIIPGYERRGTKKLAAGDVAHWNFLAKELSRLISRLGVSYFQELKTLSNTQKMTQSSVSMAGASIPCVI